MGKKKNMSNKLPSTSTNQSVQNVFEQLRFGESYTSLLLGIIVVVAVSIFTISFVRDRVAHAPKVDVETSQTEVPSTKKVQTAVNTFPKTYVVAQDDDLWNIAEKTYKSGYAWVEIARANNLSNPDILEVGTKIVLPDVKNIVKTVTADVPQAEIKDAMVHKITDKTYTVQAGDKLWDIAVRAYGDGYKWVEIARANNLNDPNLIFSGNDLKIP